MSRQSKLRGKRKHNVAKQSGPTGASGVPSRQMAPPWVRNGRRVPKAVRERAAKLQAEREAAAREAAVQRRVVDAVLGATLLTELREAADGT